MTSATRTGTYEPGPDDRARRHPPGAHMTQASE